MGKKKTNLKAYTDPFSDSGFARFFNELYPSLYRYCLSLVGSSVIAEDIVQDQFVYLWENRERLNDQTQLKSYLYTCVKHRSVDHLRKKFAWNIDPLETISEHDFKGKLHDPSEILENKELGKVIEKAVAALPEKCRIIFAMKKMAGLTNKEIADQLHISVKTVENQMTIALKKILAQVSKNWR